MGLGTCLAISLVKPLRNDHSNEDTQDPAEIGEVVAGYCLDSIIARGRTGTIYEATDVQYGERYALKVISTKLAKDAGYVKRLLREGGVVKAIQHPNIVEVIDFLRSDDPYRVAYAMELLPGLVDPLHNLRAAVHRRLPSGRPWQPEQALTQSEAVSAATVTAAASLGLPDADGLAPGHPADLAICDGDPFQPHTRVVQTWIAGRPVWHAPDQSLSHRR